MSRRFTRLFLLSGVLFASEVWAIGLGDITLESALNEPLRAQIVLLSANPDEVADLSVTLASDETFERYGIDRPFYLQGVEFNVVNGGVDGSIIEVRSRSPITEPFLTFLVEATWSSGRLLREYTVLLDPPTFAPPTTQQAPPVSAPVRSTPSDSGRIERQPTPTPAPQQTRPLPQPAPPVQQPVQQTPEPVQQAPEPVQPTPEPVQQATQQPVDEAPAPSPQPVADTQPYATSAGGDFQVRRGQSLWGIARHLRPDSRLTMNQTMLAIYEANPEAFQGNVNFLKEGAVLRIPSADEVFQISRGDAFSELTRQHQAWDAGAGYVVAQPEPAPSLTLVPPDEDPLDSIYDDSASFDPISREEEIGNRIVELETVDVPNQPSLIEIRDNELASLRQELADIRGEVYEPPADDLIGDDTMAADDALTDDALTDDAASDDVLADDIVADDAAADVDGAVEDEAPEPASVIRTSSSRDESIVDKIMGFLSQWGIIIGALLLVAGGLVWFMRRGGDDIEEAGPWDRLDSDDSDDLPMSPMSATEAIESPQPQESIVVVEQDSNVQPILEDTLEAPSIVDVVSDVDAAATGFGSLEDTFSSETAVNLDQTDPIAEADFHMAYGLYDQAADLINGALETDPSDRVLMAKLCEIYFVWGNRDAFVDAASRLKATIGDSVNADWDKIVIMGQQIAADHNLFAGAEVIGATKEVDLSFDEDGDNVGALDMDFSAAAGDSGSSDLIDLSADIAAAPAQARDAVDFDFDEPAAENDSSVIDFDVTAESTAINPGHAEVTAAMAALDTPAIEEQFSDIASSGGTAEMPALDESLHNALAEVGQEGDETAEINLDELDLGGLGLDELEATGQNESLSDTGVDEAFDDMGVTTGTHEEVDETLLVGDDLLDATGHTQVLNESMGIDAAAALGDGDATMLAPSLGSDETVSVLPGDAETMLAPLDDDDDYDFAKTEGPLAETQLGNLETDETIAAPALAATDMDLDLDDLTAALQVSDANDTAEHIRDEATIEQPLPSLAEATAEVPTMSLSAQDMSTDLNEARTMTEVGTKLDLARAYVDMGDPAGARSILEEVLDEGDGPQKQQAQQLLDSLPS